MTYTELLLFDISGLYYLHICSFKSIDFDVLFGKFLYHLKSILSLILWFISHHLYDECVFSDIICGSDVLFILSSKLPILFVCGKLYSPISILSHVGKLFEFLIYTIFSKPYYHDRTIRISARTIYFRVYTFTFSNYIDILFLNNALFQVDANISSYSSKMRLT